MSKGKLYLLFESAAGYALFQQIEGEQIGIKLDEVQKAVSSLENLSKIIKLVSFQPFLNNELALDACKSISEGCLPDSLKDFLNRTFTQKSHKKKKSRLGVADRKLGSAIQETLDIPCDSTDIIHEYLREIRHHLHHFIKELSPLDIDKSHLGLAHAFSRSVVQFDINRVDNMVMQSIALLDTLDKDINTFAMRAKEWYGWHFPELSQIVKDNFEYCRCVAIIKNRSRFSEMNDNDISSIKQELTQALNDNDKVDQVMNMILKSMGRDLSEIDMVNIHLFSSRVASLASYRKQLHEYLLEKMNCCAPNLSVLIGEIVGARLISHAGSLIGLAKYPASTVQILGAEKALFRALKKRGNTPKYGLIFHSSFIGQSKPQCKGKMARYLANKCSLAARIDSFATQQDNTFGESLKDLVKEKLASFNKK